MSASIEDMCVDHGRTDVPMPEELLDCPNSIAILEQMGGKQMPEGVATGRFGDPGLASGFFHGLLKDGFMQVMSVLFEGYRIGVNH
jgi:hypothetical protein